MSQHKHVTIRSPARTDERGTCDVDGVGNGWCVDPSVAAGASRAVGRRLGEQLAARRLRLGRRGSRQVARQSRPRLSRRALTKEPRPGAPQTSAEEPFVDCRHQGMTPVSALDRKSAGSYGEEHRRHRGFVAKRACDGCRGSRRYHLKLDNLDPPKMTPIQASVSMETLHTGRGEQVKHGSRAVDRQFNRRTSIERD